jgi:hypothetical protein
MATLLAALLEFPCGSPLPLCQIGGDGCGRRPELVCFIVGERLKTSTPSSTGFVTTTTTSRPVPWRALSRTSRTPASYSPRDRGDWGAAGPRSYLPS